MKHITLLAIIGISLAACQKDNKYFKLRTLTINSYSKKNLPQQRIYVRVVNSADAQQVIGVSASYPSDLPLPVTLGVTSSLKQTLYKRPCVIELWGDITGLLSSEEINIAQYKIIFPLEMDVENEVMDVTLKGSWD